MVAMVSKVKMASRCPDAASLMRCLAERPQQRLQRGKGPMCTGFRLAPKDSRIRNRDAPRQDEC